MCGVSSSCTSFHHSATMLETEWPLMDSQAPGMGRARGSGKAARSQWTVATWHAGLAPAEITLQTRLPPRTRHAPRTQWAQSVEGPAGGGAALACLGRLCAFVSMSCGSLCASTARAWQQTALHYT